MDRPAEYLMHIWWHMEVAISGIYEYKSRIEADKSTTKIDELFLIYSFLVAPAVVKQSNVSAWLVGWFSV